MDLIAYIRLFKKWFWLLFLGAFLAGGVAFLLRSQQSEKYQAQVTVLIGSYIEAPNPDQAEIRTGVELAPTYAVLAQTYDVLEAAVQAGSFPITASELRAALSAHVVEDTSLLRLTVTYTNPALAADMANEVAVQLIVKSPSNLTPEQQDQIRLATDEITILDKELQEAREERSELNAQLDALKAAPDADRAEIERLTEQRNKLVDQINLASATKAQYADTITTLQQRTNSLDIVEQARVPTAPIGISVVVATLLGMVVGIALAAGIALLIEYLDDTVRTPEEATQMLALPTLASITRFGKPRDSYPKRLVTYLDPGSPVSEEYRALRTNLLFSSNGQHGKETYIITSPGPSEGKSVTIANLAVTMAMAGLRVLLVDADLRRPKLHSIFRLDNRVGLSTLLYAEPSEKNGEDRSQAPQNLKDCLQETEIPGLRVITSGFIPINPTEALGSVAMQRWYQEFRSARNVDIILFDTPPTLFVADSTALAAAIQAPVVIVLEAGQTRRGAALRAKEQFSGLDVEIRGVVLNAVNPRERGYHYGYSYYYYYRDSGASDRDDDVRQP